MEMAGRHNGVIINCDAMQSYDALHVLTAQPTAQDRLQCPHALYGHLHPATHYSAADWRSDAINAIQSAWRNGQTAILCGGTGFYLKALMDGLSPIPDIPDNVRQSVIDLHKEIGTDTLFAQLKQRDPATAELIDPKNPMRILRAWEVLIHTEKPLSHWQKQPLDGAPDGWSFHVTGIFPSRETLIKKINDRFAVMMKQGILDEVRALDTMIQTGEVPKDALIIKAHGFRQLRRYLNGEWTLDQAVNHTQIETRQYAKRQMTWLRHQIRIDDTVETP